jgi:predicted dehydrogenase
MKKLNFAVVGCGLIGERHCKHALNYGKLLAVCDIDKKKTKAIVRKYKIDNSFTDIEDLINALGNEIDVISICTPNGLHYSQTIFALNNKINVLCEKPMALSVNHCKEMIDTAKKNNVELFIVKQNRFNPPVEELKKLIEGDKLGKIFSYQLSCFWNRNSDYYMQSDWRGTKIFDGGTLFTQFSHFVDLLYWFFGDVENTHCFTDNYNHSKTIEFEDTGVVILKHKSGVSGSLNYNTNSFGSNMEGSLTLFSENATIKIGGKYLNEIVYFKSEKVKLPKINSLDIPNNYGNYQGSMSNHDKVYKNIVDVINEGASVKASMYDGLKCVEIISKIYASKK